MLIQDKHYFNQHSVINAIHQLTGYPKGEVGDILNAVSDVVAREASETTGETEIKISSGIKISARFFVAGQRKSNLYKAGCVPSDTIILKARLTNAYKKKVNDLHKLKNGSLV
ncbi:MAG: hypothetical protein J1F02_07865 [Lachnospiraceae bacterium]|nr:hypothetical protein [Lachnospiraceae bacterium]